MAETIELSTLAERSAEANDLDDLDVYETVRGSRIVENEYVDIRNVSERATQQADPVYANTTLVRCSAESHDSDGCTTMSYTDTGPNVTAKNKDIATIHRTLAETVTSLKQVQIMCIVLGIALVACSATLGALIFTMREKIQQSEHASDRVQVTIGKLQAQTGTAVSTNLTLAEHVLQIEEKLSIIIADNDWAYPAILELETVYNATKHVIEEHSERIRGHTSRIENLEIASSDSNRLIRNLTSALLELKEARNTSDAIIMVNSASLADLQHASQNHTAKLSQLTNLQLSNSADFHANSIKLRELEGANTVLSNMISTFNSTITKMDVMSAFTVSHPVAGPTWRTITFTNFITNIGNHYNTTSGIFTCQYPGLYYFVLHIMKKGGIDYAKCVLQKNGSYIVVVYTNSDSDSDGGYYGSTNSVMLHLVNGDRVNLASCTTPDTMYINSNWFTTTFSGFLVKAD